jgi:hypothetical protein
MYKPDVFWFDTSEKAKSASLGTAREGLPGTVRTETSTENAAAR